MSIREVEHGSLSACNIPTETAATTSSPTATLLVKPNENDANHWNESELDGNDTFNLNSNAVIHSIVPFTALPKGTTLRIQPMEWHCGGWDDEHFHSNLRLPLSSSSASQNKGMVVTLEAMARECVAVALSPQPCFQLGKTYVIHIGASSNLQTVIRRRLPNGTEAVDVSVSSPHVCSQEKYVKYWILLQNNGQVSVGIGSKPGKHCIAQMDDSLYHALRSGVDAVKFVGLGNSALGRKAKDLKVRNVRVMPIPDCFQAFGGIPISNSNDATSLSDDDQDVKVKDQELWQDYEKECAKAQRRALKFGIEYKQPAPDAFFKWSEARRLRANPDKGFITGMDIMSKEEKEKARKRKQRFEEEDRKNKTAMGMDHGDGENENDGENNNNGIEGDNDNMEDDEQIQTRNKRGPLALEQAWDNEELVGDMRTDPPESLYLKGDGEDGGENSIGNSETVMDGIDDDKATASKIVLVPTKIHLFAIDWAAFKQIRTDDILFFFKAYGPTYVEWLGELSCNVHFEDKYSAARALEALSMALPTIIPVKALEIKEMDADAQTANDDQVVVVDHDANNEMKDDTGANSNSIQQDSTEESKSISSANLGRMGWRICNYPLRKVKSDRYGKRGTRSRCIVRVATSLDVLDERPTTWPKPPPGFTTKRVLGPGSDFKTWTNDNDRSKGGGGKRRRQSRGGSYDDPDYYLSTDRDRYDGRDRDRYDDGEMEAEDSTDEFGRSAIDRGLTASR